jgi:hypothetical protein
VLRYAGPVSAHTFFSRLGGERHPEEPWMWGARVGFQPHPRLSFGVNRAAMFGGRGQRPTVERVLGMLVGVIRNSAFENQILSFDGRWRMPTDAVLPATVYLEWGADDGAGALHETPARIAGVFLPALPRLHNLSAGAEYARFGAACCGHGSWYLNSTFRGNWARGDELLAHPLGGEGTEASGYVRAELLEGYVRVGARGFRRTRIAESYVTGGGNLFTPGRAGASWGWDVDAAVRLGRPGEARARWFRDQGDGWRETALETGVRVFFQ